MSQTQERRRRAYEEQQRDAWFAEHGTAGPFPDLSFDTPDCPICLRSTNYEDGQFYCEVCDVWWPSSGYGHEAEWQGADRFKAADFGSEGAPDA